MIMVWIIPCELHYGVIRLTVTETENKYTELNGNLYCYLSLCSMNTSMQFQEPNAIGLCPCQCDYTITQSILVFNDK